MAINDTLQLAISGTLQGQLVVCTHHYRAETADNDESELLTNWRAECQASWLNLVHLTYTLTKIVARQVCGSTPLRTPVEYSYSSPQPVGTVAGADAAPNQCAGVVSLKTPLAGKSYRGRFYLPAVPPSYSAHGQVFAAYVTAANAYMANAIQLGGGVPNGNFRLVVHSPTRAQPGVQCQDCSTPVNAYILRDPLGTQRRRRVGVGA